jgi:hypothetical protein
MEKNTDINCVYLEELPLQKLDPSTLGPLDKNTGGQLVMTLPTQWYKQLIVIY